MERPQPSEPVSLFVTSNFAHNYLCCLVSEFSNVNSLSRTFKYLKCDTIYRLSQVEIQSEENIHASDEIITMKDNPN